MNYSKLKRDEAIELLKKAEDKKLELQTEYDDTQGRLNAEKKTTARLQKQIDHIKESPTVQTKLDLEVKNIKELKNQHILEKKQLKKDYQDQIAVLKQTHDKHLEAVKESHLQDYSGMQAAVQAPYEKLLSLRTKQLDGYMYQHGALLKAIQGSLDLAITANEYMSKEVVTTTQQFQKKKEE